MKIDLVKTWEIFNEEFDTDKQYHFFALSNLIRFTMEREGTKKSAKSDEYSIMHTFLHNDSVDSDTISQIKAFINNLLWIPNTYKYRKILKKLIDICPDKDDYFIVKKSPSKVTKEYRLKIRSMEYFSLSPLMYVYTGKNDNSTITFLYMKELSVDSVYTIGVGMGQINNNVNIFICGSHKDETRDIKASILKKYKLTSDDNLIEIIENKVWPYHPRYMSERSFLLDYISYYANPLKIITNPRSLFPFFSRPLIHHTPSAISNYHGRKILHAYGVDDPYIEEYELKQQMDSIGVPCLDVIDESKTYLFHKVVDGKIYYDEYLNDITSFNKIFGEVQESTLYSEGKETWDKIINLFKKAKTRLLIGPAGHGKTHSIKFLADFFIKNGKVVRLLCPTWKAIEIYEDAITHSTISGIDSKGSEFLDDADLLIIDEMTLISDWDFLARVKDETRILIAGDPNQLQPIGTNAQKYRWILQGREKYTTDLSGGENYRLHKSSNPDLASIQEDLIKKKFDHKTVKHGVFYMQSMKEIMNKLVSLSRDGFTIITKTNGGVFGADFLNRFLKSQHTTEFEVGDKIVFRKTNKKQGFHSGLNGTVTSIEGIVYTISTVNGKEVDIFHENDSYDLPFTHAYAINAHKAQGSTIKKVVVIVTGSVGYEWLYTAYSRASHDAIIIFRTGHYKIKQETRKV